MIKSHCWLIAATAIFAAGVTEAASAQSAGTAQQIDKLQDQIEALQREIHQIKAKVAKAESNARAVTAPRRRQRWEWFPPPLPPQS
jgi:cell division protein FtsB